MHYLTIEEQIKQFLIDDNINLEIDIHNEAGVHSCKNGMRISM